MRPPRPSDAALSCSSWLLLVAVSLATACSSRDGVQSASTPEHQVDGTKTSQSSAASGAAPASAEPASALGAKDASPTDTRPRIGALGPHTWIWKKPSKDGLAIGKMRVGTTVPLQSTTPVNGPDCKGKWYAIEPRGFVCDDSTATLELDEPYFKALAFAGPSSGLWPYRYAHSNGAPMYGRVPTPEEWKVAERQYGPVNSWTTLGAWAIGHEENILDEPIKATDEVPYFLKEGGKRSIPGGNYSNAALVWKRMPAGSMLSYAKAFEMHGRVWLLTPETMVVPADRVSDMKRSVFKGVQFGETDMRLPFAWNRSKVPVPKYEKTEDGAFRATGETIAAKTPVEISDVEVKKDAMVYYELRREPGHYIGKTTVAERQLDVDVVVARAATKLPSSVGADEKWLEVKVVPGTLTAYVGLTPVMSTLYSPGKGGPPSPGYKFPEDHSKYATTALGHFPLEWKERVATMSNEKGEPKVLWFSDVPFQQYLRAPLAMHVAYWHEDYGKRKSAECVNVSPMDGQWLFGWTLPNLPEGWNAVGAGQGNGKSTPIVVTSI